MAGTRLDRQNHCFDVLWRKVLLRAGQSRAGMCILERLQFSSANPCPSVIGRAAWRTCDNQIPQKTMLTYSVWTARHRMSHCAHVFKTLLFEVIVGGLLGQISNRRLAEATQAFEGLTPEWFRGRDGRQSPNLWKHASERRRIMYVLSVERTPIGCVISSSMFAWPPRP